MSRLHGALQRSTEGKAPILPPDAGIPADQDVNPAQPAFSVPWKIDAQGPGATPETPVVAAEEPPTHLVGFPSAATELPPATPSVDSEKLVTAAASGGQADLAMAVEQYRKLAATLHHAQADRGMKLIMVTSANPGEGKSLTASNLALTLAESYQRRVLIIDADLRRPSLHDVFGLPNHAGLSDGLGRSSIEGLRVVEVSPRLSVLPSGRPMEDPTGALTSGQMRRILEEARAGYDWVIIDTPPVGMLTDARLLAEMVDGVVLVIEAEKSPYPDIQRAIDTLGRERLLGAVLNRLPLAPGSGQYYASYYARYYRRQKAPRT
jgi:capsular exopolysaccharide synthesis family protein